MNDRVRFIIFVMLKVVAVIFIGCSCLMRTGYLNCKILYAPIYGKPSDTPTIIQGFVTKGGLIGFLKNRTGFTCQRP